MKNQRETRVYVEKTYFFACCAQNLRKYTISVISEFDSENLEIFISLKKHCWAPIALRFATGCICFWPRQIFMFSERSADVFSSSLDLHKLIWSQWSRKINTQYPVPIPSPALLSLQNLRELESVYAIYTIAVSLGSSDPSRYSMLSVDRNTVLPVVEKWLLKKQSMIHWKSFLSERM